MMEALPLDTNHPAVRDYLALVRLQVLTPLSLVINMATMMVCSIVMNPGLADVSRLYPAVIAPDPYMIAAYIVAIYLGQIGYCLLLLLARKPETKEHSGQRGWVTSRICKLGHGRMGLLHGSSKPSLYPQFFLGVLLVLLIYANIVLLVYHAPTMERPFDLALIHAPMRAFMILPLGVLFHYSLFAALGWTWTQGDPQHYSRHQMTGMGIMLGVNLLGLAVIVIRRDIVWCVAASWICASIWTLKPKPFPVWITVVIFTIVHPLALVASALYSRLHKREGHIALPPDEDHPGHAERAPREVDAEALWG